MVASTMESLNKLARRIKTWRSEYGVFGKLSGESLNQMDQAVHALSGESRARISDEVEGGDILHTGDDDAIDVLHGVITGLEELAEADDSVMLAEAVPEYCAELEKLAPVLEDLHRATREHE
jgi:hypothetical protein